MRFREGASVYEGCRRTSLAVLALLLAWSAGASAQDAILDQLYGSGVHNFYSGNYPQAIADLTESAQGGSKDPRVFYFAQWPS